MGRSPNELVSRELPRGGILTATLPGWNWCYCPLPRAKPGLLDGQPSRLVNLITAIIATWQNRGYWKSIPYSWVGFITIIITWQFRGYWKTRGYIENPSPKAGVYSYS